MCLGAIEDADTSLSMWTALNGRCLESIVAIRAITDKLSLSVDGVPVLAQLYAYAALLQMYWSILELPPSDSGLSKTLHMAISLLRSMQLDISGEIGTALVHPLFTIGCLARSANDRSLVRRALTRVAKERGKANATLAKEVLEELWNVTGKEDRFSSQSDLEHLTSE